MVNATQMAKPFGKLPNEFLRLPSTTTLIKAIAGKSRIALNQLVVTKRGGNNPGTWMHEDVALSVFMNPYKIPRKNFLRLFL